MQDELRDRIKNFLDQHRLGVLSPAGGMGTWAVPIQRRRPGLELVCLLPRWSDALFQLEQDPQVEIVILDVADGPLRWLHIRGTADLIAPGEPDFCAEPDAAVLVIPRRVDLFDERLGWGARETLELVD